MQYEPVIGLEVHVEMLTKSKMFCACPVVDLTTAAPNTAVCPVCAGMPGTLPVINEKVVEFALRVALALECEIAPVSVFARKNYFYPDLPKGYQITQYEQPLAVNGKITLRTSQGEKVIRIRRVHLEEDTGKLTHVEPALIPVNVGGTDQHVRPNDHPPAQREFSQGYSLVDLNRAGVPLLEIVTEPDFRSAEEVRMYGMALRSLVRYLGVNSGDLEKGVMRIEPNISIRPVGRDELGTKVEIKNLNSFRSLERGVAYEIRRHEEVLRAGGTVAQETVGWDEGRQATFSQRTKEDAHDYRYFPEPDLPPLVVDPDWVAEIRQALPELPQARIRRFVRQYGLSDAESAQLVEEKAVGDYYEKVVAGLRLDRSAERSARTVFAWLTGELLALMNAAGAGIESVKIQPQDLAELLKMIADGKINQNTGKSVLAEMFGTGKPAAEIVAAKGLTQVSDMDFIAKMVTETLAENAKEVDSFRAGKTTVANFLFGQVMRKAGGKANPQVVRAELEKQLQSWIMPL